MDAKLKTQSLTAILGTFFGLLLSLPASALQCRSTFLPPAKLSQESIDLAINELALMKLTLDTSKVLGSTSLEHTLLTITYPERESALLRMLESHKLMTREQAKEKIRAAIAQLQNRKAESSKKEQEQRTDAREAMKEILITEGLVKIQPVEAGQKIEKQFWMSATPITQHQWATVAALFPEDIRANPSVHATGKENSQIVPLPNGKDLEMQPENPVEYVNAIKDKNDRDYYDSAYNFIEKLNELSKKDDPTIYQLIHGHQKGMIYDLPSEAQYEHVISNYGTSKSPTAAKLFEYAHINSNYGTGTVPVASLKAHDVAGGKFYDLLGNVGTLSSSMKGDEVIVKGGSYRSDNKIKFTNRTLVEASSQSDLIGFRIVGTLP